MPVTLISEGTSQEVRLLLNQPIGVNSMSKFFRIDGELSDFVQTDTRFVNLDFVREIIFFKSENEEYVELEYRGSSASREFIHLRISHDSEEASALRRFLDENRLNQKSC